MRRGISTIGATAIVAGLTLHAADPRRSLPLQLQREATTGTGLLMGVVVDPLTGQTVASSLVTLTSSTESGSPAVRPVGAAGSAVAAVPVGHQALTDDEGHFVFSDLPKGTYTLVASMMGYSDGAYGRRRPSGPMQTLPLGDGERIGDLKIPIWRHAAIAGTVVDEIAEPLVDVPVQVLRRIVVAGTRRWSPGPIVRTDDRGFYRIGSLSPGDYVVVVPSTQMTAPDSVADLYLQVPMAANAGGPTDLAQALSSGGTVRVLRTGFKVDGLRFLSSTNVRSGATPAPSADGRIVVYPTHYYPAAATAAQATVITVRSGEERGGVDVSLILAPTSRVSGMVAGPDGRRSVGLALVPAGDDLLTDAGLVTATTVSDAAGRFTFLGVPPGSYVLQSLTLSPAAGNGATPPGSTSPTLWATQSVSVEASDAGDVAVALREGFRIAGHVEFDDAAHQPSPDEVARITVIFEPADGRPLPMPQLLASQFDAGGRFQSAQLPPGRYELRINNAPPGWCLKEARVDGRDVSTMSMPLEHDVSGVVITLTDHPSELNGQVHTASGTVDSTATVLVFPAQSAGWMDTGATPNRLRAIRTDKDGGYRAVGLPAGDYLIVAVADESTTDWQDPKSLQALARVAIPVTLGDGDARTMVLKTVPR